MMVTNAETLLKSALSELEDAAEAFGQLAAMFEVIAETRVAENMDLAGAGHRLAAHLNTEFLDSVAVLTEKAGAGRVAPETDHAAPRS